MNLEDALKIKLGDTVYAKGSYQPLTVIGRTVQEFPPDLFFCVKTKQEAQALVRYSELYLLPSGYVDDSRRNKE